MEDSKFLEVKIRQNHLRMLYNRHFRLTDDDIKFLQFDIDNDKEAILEFIENYDLEKSHHIKDTVILNMRTGSLLRTKNLTRFITIEELIQNPLLLEDQDLIDIQEIVDNDPSYDSVLSFQQKLESYNEFDLNNKLVKFDNINAEILGYYGNKPNVRRANDPKSFKDFNFIELREAQDTWVVLQPIEEMLSYFIYSSDSGKSTAQNQVVTSDIAKALEFFYGNNNAEEFVQDPNIYYNIIAFGTLHNEARVKLKNILNIQYFQTNFFFIDKVSHIDVPLHIRLSENEKNVKLKEMRVTLNGLNIIRYTDPISQYYNFQPGDLIKIYRQDYGLQVINPQTIAYRTVTI